MKKKFESTEKWLYLEGDSCDPTFARIGITVGNLGSRSYRLTRPTSYLFCAFKFKHDISELEAECVKEEVLYRMDAMYIDRFNTTRLDHYESGRITESFQPVDFIQFYKDVHFDLYINHRESFVIADYKGYGEFVDCIFNPEIDNSDFKYTEMIVQFV